MCNGNMAIQNNHRAGSEAILENVWASFIGTEDGVEKRTSDAAELSKSWEELPYLDGRDGSMDILQRLPSLGSDTPMLSEENVSIPRKRASREWEQNNGMMILNHEQPEMKRMSCMKDSCGDEFDVLEFQDLGAEYLDNLLSSF
ncbi:hypothetical protein Pint_10482 [Pistacia integerrima]|uniref:Uncharacterized protein n=1 Tax=Pistacia integerrima TaxID=434235 RepID=A0ACC0XEB9_9ROSI|nr:hypothetical protein Pint_10482 [Pistacia integerrima]